MRAKKNILLTGGSGFIGKNIFEFFCKDYKIFKPSHTEIDLSDKDQLRKFIQKNGIRVVIHTAVEPGLSSFDSTLKMYLSIYESLDLLDKFINFGSGAEYGKNRDLIKISEDNLGVSIPEDQYGLSKLICSKLSFNNEKIVTLLPFGVFGKYENYCCKFISNAITKSLFGFPIKIKQNVVFDYLYIDDLMLIIDFLLKNFSVYGDLNATPDTSISLLEIVDIINHLSDKRVKVVLENDGYNYQYTGSNLKIKNKFPGLNFVPYEESIRRLINFYRLNLEKLDKHAIVNDEYFLKSKIRRHYE